MRTSFSPEQLRDPELAEANGILETCVHYGFCTNTCPTYVLTRDENESPRGRIDLIRAMLEKGGAPDPRTVGHLDRCLSCLSCMTTCAAKVDYVHLIDRARIHVERHHRRPLPERLQRALLATVLPRPRLFALALRAGRAIRGARPFLPRRLRTLLDMIPDGGRGEILAPQVFPAEGARRRRVALLAGCAQQALDGDINAATIRVLRRLGCEVVVAAGAGCCGSLTLHMGREDAARRAASAAILAWNREIAGAGLDAILVNASGCGTTVKDYAHLFRRDPALAAPALRVAGLARDICEFIGELDPPLAGQAPPHRVAYHDPCSMQHGQRIMRQPRELLHRAGFQVFDVPEGHFCCGSAGTYNLLQPATAETLGRRKAAHIRSTDPDIVATGNIGCMTQLGHYLDRPVLHTVQLLDWAAGGPIPPSLAGVSLRVPEPAPVAEPSADAASAEGAANEVGFW